MSKVHPERYTAHIGQDGVAVFLIGMRINRLHRVDKWLPTFVAMPRMLRHLFTHKDSGLLGMRNWFGRTTILVSYWESVEAIQRFASDPEAPHAAAWRRFTREVAGSGIVGIWHETYLIEPGRYEAVYSGMPVFGLAGATSHLPVRNGMRTAKQRWQAGTTRLVDG